MLRANERILHNKQPINSYIRKIFSFLVRLLFDPILRCVRTTGTSVTGATKSAVSFVLSHTNDSLGLRSVSDNGPQLGDSVLSCNCGVTVKAGGKALCPRCGRKMKMKSQSN